LDEIWFVMKILILLFLIFVVLVFFRIFIKNTFIDIKKKEKDEKETIIDLKKDPKTKEYVQKEKND